MSRWRSETEYSSDGVTYGETVCVKEGELFWSRAPDGRIRSNEGREGGGTMSTTEERMLDPAPLLGEYRFEATGETTRLGRAAIQVRATRRVGAHPHDFGPLADALALVVDRERGILLRAAVVVKEEEISVHEVTDLAFDEPISSELFRPPSPPPDDPTVGPH